MAAAVCFGELLVDMVSDTADASLAQAPRFLKAPGGAPANVAVGLARLGTATRFAGQVGDDPFGHWLRHTLANENVDVSTLLTSATARTTIAFVATRSDGRKDICFYRNPGADAEIAVKDIRPALLEGAHLFHCGGVSLSQRPARDAQLHAVEMARDRGLLISYDPNYRESLWSNAHEARQELWKIIPFCDIVKLAEEEWEFLTQTNNWEEGARKIRELGPRLVVVTRGAHGAYYDWEDGSGEAHGFHVNATDTLGAGDAFMAGLLHQVLHHRTLDEVLDEANLANIMRFANACGALTTTKSGAIPALPTLDEVTTFLNARLV